MIDFATHYENLFFIYKNTLFDVVTRSGIATLSIVKEKNLFKEEIKQQRD
jgi:hypothetical protein